MRTNCLVMLFSIFTVVASAQVQQQKDSGTIRLRCSGNIAANDVLYVVDGVPVPNDKIKQLNPADIVSIDLLKEADQKLFSCRNVSPVIIITTKKANRKSFTVVDAKTNVGVSAASLHITSVNAGKMMDFIADEYGRYVTDSLIADESLITVTATGYESLKMTGKQAKQARYRFELKPIFVELKEITVVAGTTIKCGRGLIKLPAAKMDELNGVLRCIGFGVSVSEGKSSSNRPVFLYQPKIKVYPNPVAANGAVQLSFSDLKPGDYHIRLLNASGQILYSFQKQIAAKNEMQQLPFHTTMPAGMYMIQIMDENKALLQSTKLLVQ